jgi:hypothetical protein
MKIKYITTEPEKADKVLMDLPADARKPYAILMLHMMAQTGETNGGLRDDISHLAEICGLIDIEMSRQLETIVPAASWRRVRGLIYSKEVRFQILRAKKRSQDHKESGLIGSYVKKRRLSVAKASLGSEGREEEKITSFPGTAQIIPLPAVEFAQKVNAIIPLKPKDWPSVENVGKRTAKAIQDGKCSEGVYEKMLEMAREAKRDAERDGARAIRYWFASLKLIMGYTRQSRGGMNSIGELVKGLVERVG